MSPLLRWGRPASWAGTGAEPQYPSLIKRGRIRWEEFFFFLRFPFLETGYAAEKRQLMTAAETAEGTPAPQILGVAVPLWKKKTGLGSHIKHTATQNHTKKIS